MADLHAGAPRSRRSRPSTSTSDLDQGWGSGVDAAPRQAYYYTPQGTSLRSLRYDWLVNLEMPWGERRVRRPRAPAVVRLHRRPAADGREPGPASRSASRGGSTPRSARPSSTSAAPRATRASSWSTAPAGASPCASTAGPRPTPSRRRTLGHFLPTLTAVAREHLPEPLQVPPLREEGPRRGGLRAAASGGCTRTWATCSRRSCVRAGRSGAGTSIPSRRGSGGRTPSRASRTASSATSSRAARRRDDATEATRAGELPLALEHLEARPGAVQRRGRQPMARSMGEAFARRGPRVPPGPLRPAAAARGALSASVAGSRTSTASSRAAAARAAALAGGGARPDRPRQGRAGPAALRAALPALPRRARAAGAGEARRRPAADRERSALGDDRRPAHRDRHGPEGGHGLRLRTVDLRPTGLDRRPTCGGVPPAPRRAAAPAGASSKARSPSCARPGPLERRSWRPACVRGVAAPAGADAPARRARMARVPVATALHAILTLAREHRYDERGLSAGAAGLPGRLRRARPARRSRRSTRPGRSPACGRALPTCTTAPCRRSTSCSRRRTSATSASS